MSDSIVEVTDLSRRFGDLDALQHVNHRAGEGRIYGLVGVNGTGKTTLIEHLSGCCGRIPVPCVSSVRIPLSIPSTCWTTSATSRRSENCPTG